MKKETEEIIKQFGPKIYQADNIRWKLRWEFLEKIAQTEYESTGEIFEDFFTAFDLDGGPDCGSTKEFTGKLMKAIKKDLLTMQVEMLEQEIIELS